MLKNNLRFAWFTTIYYSILDTVSLVLTVEIMYGYVVTDFGNPLLLLKANR